MRDRGMRRGPPTLAQRDAQETERQRARSEGDARVFTAGFPRLVREHKFLCAPLRSLGSCAASHYQEKADTKQEHNLSIPR